MHPTPVGVKGHVAPAPRIGVPFAPIPLDVKARRDVSPAAKLVFATVANQARMRRGEVSDLTNRQISDRAGLSVAAVRRGLDQLEALGLVRRLFGESKRTRLGVAVAYKPAPGVAQAEQPSSMGVAQARRPGCPAPPSGGCAPGATDLLRRGEEHSKTGPTPSTGGEEGDMASRVASGPEAARYLRLCIEAGRRGEPMPPLPCPEPGPVAPNPALDPCNPPTTPAPVVAPTPEKTVPATRHGASPAATADRPATAKPEASTTTTPIAGQRATGADRGEATRHTPGMAAVKPRPEVGFRRTTGEWDTLSHPPGAWSPMVSPAEASTAVARMTRGLAEGLKAPDLGRRRVGPRKLARQLAEVRRKYGGRDSKRPDVSTS